MSRSLIFIIIVSMTAGVEATAQDVVWEQTNGPEGANVGPFAVTTNGAIIASFESGDPFVGPTSSVYSSTDGGLTWVFRRATDLPVKRIEAIPGGDVLIHTARYNYTVGVYGGKLYRVTGNGAEWTHLGQTGNPSEVVARNDGSVWVNTPEGILRSGDGGETWIFADNGLPTDPEMRWRGLSAEADGFYILLESGESSHLYRLAEGGTGWTKIGPTPAGSPVGLAGTTSGELYLGSAEWVDGDSLVFPIWRSDDGGVSWDRIDAGLQLGCADLHVDAQGRLFAAQIPVFCGPENGVWVLPDRDRDWIDLTANLSAQADWTLRAGENGGTFFGANPMWGDGGLFMLAKDSYDLEPVAIRGIIGTNVTGLAAASSGVMLALVGSRLWYSNDGGDNWNRRDDVTGFQAIVTGRDGLVFARRDTLLFYSQDEGLSWSPVRSPAKGYWIAIDSRGHLLVSGYWEGLFVSADLGMTWERRTDDLEGPYRSILVDPDDNLYVLTETTLFRSEDDGITWSERTIGISTGSISMLVYAGNDGLLFASTPYGFTRRSSDGGLTWTNVGVSAFDSGNRVVMIQAGDGSIYAGTQLGGVFRSDDNGDSWHSVNDALDHQSVAALAIDAGGTVYAGTRGGGVYRTRSRVESAREDLDAPPQRSFALESIYPNPTSGNIRVKFRTERQGSVRIDVVNVLGQVVVVPVDERRLAGTHEVDLSTSRLPPGAYLVRLRVDERAVARKLVVTRTAGR